MFRLRLSWIAAAAVCAAAFSVQAQDRDQTHTPLPAGAQFVKRELHMVVPGTEPGGLDAVEMYVNAPGKHPLALLTHGTSDDPSVRNWVTPWPQLSQALENCQTHSRHACELMATTE